MSFCMIFSYVILGWYHDTIVWDENINYFFNWEKKTVLGPIRSLFQGAHYELTNIFLSFEVYNVVCLLNFHQQIIVISSQNNVRKYRTKGHE